MSLRFYDEAVKQTISKWVLDPEVTITSPDETRRLFEYKADISKDSPIKLPLISIRRSKDVNINNVNKRPLSFDAGVIAAQKEGIKSLSGIPITLRYQIDIYTRFFEECDEYLRNFIFKIVNNPRLNVYIPYNEVSLMHHCNMRLLPEVTDNSDIPERLAPGQFTRFTIAFQIEDAYLFAVPIRKAWSINIDNALDVKLKSEQGSELNSDPELDIEANINNSLKSKVGISINEIDASTS